MEYGYREFDTVDDFLLVAGAFLNSDPVVNGLMLGVLGNLARNPLHYGARPYCGAIERGGEVALAALMTPPYRLQLLTPSAECPAEAVRLLASSLRAGNRPVPGVLARTDVAEFFGAAWSALSGQARVAGLCQRVHELRRVNEIEWPAGGFGRAGGEDLDLAAGWAEAFHAECFGTDEVVTAAASVKTIRSLAESGKLYFWRAGVPVSMAGRVRPVAGGESLSYVYTPPPERGKGYASAVVARLAALILAEGKSFCSLYTDLSNPTSNKIYRRIGFLPRADVVNVDFKTA